MWLLVLSACALTAARADLSASDYEVIAVVLNHGLGDDPGLLLIDDRTTSGSLALSDADQTLVDLAAQLETSPAILRAWRLANRKNNLLQDKLDITATYRFIDERERNEIFQSTAANGDDPESGWQELRSKYPQAIGIVRVSRPGFDSNQSSAAVYVEFECGANCGSGRFVTVTRPAGGVWQVSGGSLVWMAAD